MSLAGTLPIDYGMIDLDPTEMMFWMYCPIKVPYSDIVMPDNLFHNFSPIISKILEKQYVAPFYMYLTAKTLWVEGSYIGNRPGWHIDGYGTDDINFIWYDRVPTEFLYMKDLSLIELSDDCDESLNQMEALALNVKKTSLITHPAKHLLRLDNKVIHRSPVNFEAGMRTFVKVSLSKEKYNLKGNSINHLLPETHWPLVDRKEVRNHPVYKNSDFIK